MLTQGRVRPPLLQRRAIKLGGLQILAVAEMRVAGGEHRRAHRRPCARVRGRGKAGALLRGARGDRGQLLADDRLIGVEHAGG